MPEALQVAGEDISAGLAMLDARHIAGDADLSALLVGGARRQWRTGIASRFEELVEHTQARWQRSGEIAHRAEPDLKNGRGGLRDVQLLNALAIAQLADVYPSRSLASPTGTLGDAHLALLNVRTELHRISGRGREMLQAQYADEIGAALRIGDRFDLARMLSDAARTISYYVDAGLRTAANALPRRGFAALRRPVRRPLDEGVIEFGGRGHPGAGRATRTRSRPDPARRGGLGHHRAADGGVDAEPTVRGGARAAHAVAAPGAQGSAGDAGRRARDGGHRRGARSNRPVGQALPEWGAVRDLPPRDVVHIWTVDRHLVETVSRASAFTTRVSRPDLLVLGALVHDIGKGRGGDHSVIGADLATQIGTRLGLWPSDVEVLSKIVRYHLLLPDTATRRDLQDPKTIAAVVDALGGDSVLLELLHALAEADSLATGPGVWGDWKASLIGDLVRRCRLVMAGEPLPQPDPDRAAAIWRWPPTAACTSTSPPADAHVYNVTMIAPDRRGLLSKAAGVLALNSLRVHSASVNSHEGVAINTFVVSPHFGAPPAAELLRQQFILALDGDLDVIGSLEQRDREAAATNTTRAGEIRAAVPVNHAARAAADPLVRGHLARRVRRADPQRRPHRAVGPADGRHRT